MSSYSAGSRRRGFDIWPGFVDALATLLMVIIFVLMVFVLSQFYLSAALSGRDEALGRLNRQISELSQMLSIEKETSAELRLNIAQLAAELQTSTAQRDQLQVRVGDLSRERESLLARLGLTEQRLAESDRRLTQSEQRRAEVEAGLAQTEQQRMDVVQRLSEAERRLLESERLRAEIEASLTQSEQLRTQTVQRLSDTLQRLTETDQQLSLAEQLRAQIEQRLALTEQRLAQTDQRLAQTEQQRAQSEQQRIQAERSLALTEQQRAQLEQRQALTEQQRADLQQRFTQTEQRLSETDQQLILTEEERARLEQARTLDQQAIEKLAADGARLLADIDVLRKVRDDLEARVGELAARLEASAREVGALRDTSKQLEARLATAEERRAAEEARRAAEEARRAGAEERTLLSQRAREETAARLTEQERLTQEAQAQVEALNRQLLALRQQLARISAALDVSEEKSKERQVQIADLGRRLNLALASKVEELARYRSEFFGRLREALGDRPDIRVVGDRFVFQSEVLFGSGSATLGLEGQEQLWQLARTLKEVIATIPTDINWVLQVDGHTDTVPIATSQFPSNWELSTARATSVVKFLVSQGLPADRLAAAGYGEFQPLDGQTDDVSRRRNRRIELKLTSR